MAEKDNKRIRLRDTKLSELGTVPVFEWLDTCWRVMLLLGASIAVDIASGSPLWGVGAFCALSYLGLKIDQVTK
jgi:hypothetical protein